MKVEEHEEVLTIRRMMVELSAQTTPAEREAVNKLLHRLELLERVYENAGRYLASLEHPDKTRATEPKWRLQRSTAVVPVRK